ncbi:MAG: hypothetical protein WBP41_16955 [Saprospiraceae bacterium]
MKIIQLLIFFLLSLQSGKIFCQRVVTCDTIYDYVETMPRYLGRDSGISDFALNEIAPIISKCIKRDSILTASVFLELVIDKSGSVQDVKYQRILATELCKDELRKHLMTLKNFSPGIHNGKPVCSRFYAPIRCLLWQ